MMKPLEGTFVFTFFIYAIIACFLAGKALLRKGMNAQMRRVIVFRQITYQLILFITGVPYNIGLGMEFFEWSKATFFLDNQDIPDLANYLYFRDYIHRYWNEIAEIILNTRGTLIFIWLCWCPIFRFCMR